MAKRTPLCHLPSAESAPVLEARILDPGHCGGGSGFRQAPEAALAFGLWPSGLCKMPYSTEYSVAPPGATVAGPSAIDPRNIEWRKKRPRPQRRCKSRCLALQFGAQLQCEYLVSTIGTGIPSTSSSSSSPSSSASPCTNSRRGHGCFVQRFTTMPGYFRSARAGIHVG